MKKNKMMRLASAMLVLTLLSTCAISGSFAKYTSTASGSATATVAKWDITVNETSIVTNSMSFDLFGTINDTGNTEDETNVSDNLIAPGTSGSFAIKVKNTAEVTAKYNITLSETNNSSIPLQYSLDGTTWKDSIAKLSTTGLTDQTLGIDAAEVTHTVYWRWVFEGTTTGAHASQTDATDTSLGMGTSAPSVTITASITATQVD